MIISDCDRVHAFSRIGRNISGHALVDGFKLREECVALVWVVDVEPHACGIEVAEDSDLAQYSAQRSWRILGFLSSRLVRI
jgi:hypothetical protein